MKYRLVFSVKGKKEKEFSFSYISIKDINCRIYSSGFEICFDLKKELTNESFENSFYKRIIKRCLFYYFVYKSGFNGLLKQYSVNIDNENKGNLKFEFRVNIECPNITNKKQLLEDIKVNSLSNKGWRIVSFINLTNGLNSVDFIRFSYYWSSFNSYYNSLSSSKRSCDKESFALLAKKNAFNHLDLTIKERNAIFKDFNFKNDDDKDFKQLRNLINNNSNYSNFKKSDLNNFYLIHMSYYLRCLFLHGNDAISLFEDSNSTYNKMIEKCNELLFKFMCKVF